MAVKHLNKLAATFLLALSLGSMETGHSLETNSANTKTDAFTPTKGGDWFTRLRVLYLLPNNHSGSLSTTPHSGVSVSQTFTGEFDFGYMFTKYLGSELILGTSHNSLWGQKALSGTKIGSTWVLPPTLTLQLRLFPSSKVQPYFGGGINYTLFYGEHCSIDNTHLKLKHSWGPAAQVGADAFFKGNWFINFDVKYIWMNTTAHLTGTVHGRVHVDINPWVFGLGIGRKW